MSHLNIEGPPLWVLLVIVITVLIFVIGGLTCCVLRNFAPANSVGPAYETTGEGKLTTIPYSSGLIAIRTITVPEDEQKAAQAKGQRLVGHGTDDPLRSPTLAK
jgi:hypothetical protein